MTYTVHQPLGIVAGAGAFPLHFMRLCQSPYFVLAFNGITDGDTVKNQRHAWVRLGALGKAIHLLKKEKVSDLVFLGHFPRPALRHLFPDKEGLCFLSHLGYRWFGDDVVMRKLKSFLEKKDFRILSPQSFHKKLLSPMGFLNTVRPKNEYHEDISLGVKILDSLSWADFGQGVSIQNGRVLAVEAAEGTDHCIVRSGILKNILEPGPIYIKRAKLGQSDEMDLPVIGPQTIESLSDAGFQGIAIHCGKTLIVESERVKFLADKADLFIIGIT